MTPANASRFQVPSAHLRLRAERRPYRPGRRRRQAASAGALPIVILRGVEELAEGVLEDLDVVVEQMLPVEVLLPEDADQRQEPVHLAQIEQVAVAQVDDATGLGVRTNAAREVQPVL